MWFFLLLAVVATAEAKVVLRCSGVDVHGVYHEKEVLKTGLDKPYQLAIDYDSNTLFFSYSSDDHLYAEFESGYINLKTNEFGTISKISGGFANAVDAKSQAVYLGGNDGIYKFNYDTKAAEFIGARDVNIWQLYFKDKLYYTDYPSENAYIFENGISTRVPELSETTSMLLALDENDNIFFTNSSGLFSYKRNQLQIVKLGDYNINGFTNDVDKHVFFSTPSGIFAIDTNGEDILKLADIYDVYGVAIQADGSIIYSVKNSIVRLKPTKKNCFDK